MVRSACLVIVVALSAAAGCTQNGDYQISWRFASVPEGSGDPQEAAAACGAHGVDSILVKGVGPEDTSATEVCAAGQMVRTAPVGNWHFQVYAVDVRGQLIQGADNPDATTEMREITDGGRTVFDMVLLVPRPACSDTVDNDLDGRVDLDDPDCGNPEGTSESPSAQ